YRSLLHDRQEQEEHPGEDGILQVRSGRAQARPVQGRQDQVIRKDCGSLPKKPALVAGFFVPPPPPVGVDLGRHVPTPWVPPVGRHAVPSAARLCTPRWAEWPHTSQRATRCCSSGCWARTCC